MFKLKTILFAQTFQIIDLASVQVQKLWQVFFGAWRQTSINPYKADNSTWPLLDFQMFFLAKQEPLSSLVLWMSQTVFMLYHSISCSLYDEYYHLVLRPVTRLCSLPAGDSLGFNICVLGKDCTEEHFCFHCVTYLSVSLPGLTIKRGAWQLN